MSKMQHITTGKHQRMKWYYVYDVNGRVTQIYETHEGAENGDPCLLTTYEYVGSTNRVQKAKETDATWNSSYDI